MWRWGALVVVAATVVVAVLLIATSGDGDGDAELASATPAPNVVQAGAPGEDSRELGDEQLEATQQGPEHTAADAEFVRGMIHHHAQALEMTAYVPDRAVGRDVPLLAERMEVSQQSEIELMQTWLREHDEDVPTDSEHEHHHGGMLMPGMLTASELDRLAAAGGKTFNRLFLHFMIRHHEGAFTMIEQLRRENGGQEPELDNLIRHIEADQGIEIDRMRQVLSGR
jgi:uncharacterized protein (DUF305 family)